MSLRPAIDVSEEVLGGSGAMIRMGDAGAAIIEQDRADTRADFADKVKASIKVKAGCCSSCDWYVERIDAVLEESKP